MTLHSKGHETELEVKCTTLIVESYSYGPFGSCPVMDFFTNELKGGPVHTALTLILMLGAMKHYWRSQITFKTH
ncbi:hypothetical protein GN244_ATG12985 [Phytophthora infestans]|uniref:Uncharacterized protein n=1 Tax=Phytophthora infestans TaxID=4787 RepID=A0A833T0Q9_PHYIN|nr:hypothetical protein GN244_ATG12985 [Phytophthora infestans]KAF4134531.1 hypothetical protein GN958_ATG16282 [Phytophthora infestans]KAF4144555.1 hypothetical protein GN958_ATG06249 [Phytophthora infestans]